MIGFLGKLITEIKKTVIFVSRILRALLIVRYKHNVAFRLMERCLTLKTISQE